MSELYDSQDQPYNDTYTYSGGYAEPAKENADLTDDQTHNATYTYSGGFVEPAKENADLTDDTGLSLTETLNFQQVSHTDDQAVQDFLDGDETANSPHKLPASRNPIIRLTVGAMLVAFGVGFMLMLAIISRKPEMAEAPADIEAEAGDGDLTLSLTDNPREASAIAPEDMTTDQMKSEIALLEQRVAIAQLEDPGVPASSRVQSRTAAARTTSARNTPTTDGATSSLSSSPTATPVASRPTPAPTVVRPVIRQPTPRPATVITPRPAPRSTVQPVVRSAPPTSSASSLRPPSSPIPTFATSEPVDPQEQWQLIANAGTIGVAPVPTQDVAPNEVVTEDAITPVESAPAEYSLKGSTQVEPAVELISYEVTYPSEKETYKEPTSEKSSIPGLHDQQMPQMSHIPIGTSAMAVTPHAITWGMSQEAQFIIELSSDLLDASGNVALAAGDRLIVQAGQLDPNSGMAELVVVGVSRDGLTQPVDYRSFMVAAADGGALMAESNINDSGTMRNDIGRFAIGVLGSVGRELTKPNSQTIVNSAYGSTTSTNNGGRNITGAILADGTDSIIERMDERNENRLNELENRQPVWEIPGGTELMILVNQEIASL